MFQLISSRIGAELATSWKPNSLPFTGCKIKPEGETGKQTKASSKESLLTEETINSASHSSDPNITSTVDHGGELYSVI